MAERETARGVVDLRRGDSEIEQHAVDLRERKGGEDVGQIREPRAAESEAGVAGDERGGGRLGIRIAVEPDQVAS